MDLSLFQFDYDLTFAVFFLNADHTIYARYGTRTSTHEADKDVSLEGLAATMKAVLEIHAGYPANAQELAGKQPVPVTTKVPEDYPSLKEFKKTLDYEGEVTKSCIHCHQIRDAQRKVFRSAGKPLPEELMFPFPIPQSIGLELSPQAKSEIAEVTSGSPAELAGLRKGDSIEVVNSQRIASPADLQWVLHNTDRSQLQVVVDRGGGKIEKTIQLSENWRSETDISWRVTSWDFRRMVLGGMKLEPVESGQRKKLDVPDDQMCLLVKHVGKYGPHALSHRAGVKPDDILIEFDGRRDLLTESKIFEYGMMQRKPGDSVNLVLLRNGRKITVNIKQQ